MALVHLSGSPPKKLQKNDAPLLPISLGYGGGERWGMLVWKFCFDP